MCGLSEIKLKGSTLVYNWPFEFAGKPPASMYYGGLIMLVFDVIFDGTYTACWHVIDA